MLTKDNVQDICSLTPMQEGMLLHQAREPGSSAYVEQFDFALDGPVDAQALQAAFAALVGKYDALRTIFSYRKTDQPRQVVLRRRDARLHTEAIRAPDAGHEREQEERAIDAWKAADRARGFDLSADMLVRLALLSAAPDRHRLILTFHHIVLDGWCMPTLLGDLFGFYERLRDAPGLAIEEREAHPYRDYLRWIAGQDRAQAAAFWSEALAGYEAEAGVPYADRAGAAGATDVAHAEHAFSLGTALTARLSAVARAHRVTFSSLFQAAWGVLLQKINHVDDVVFGTVVSGRPPALPGVESMVGLFINTQPLRVACAPSEPFAAVAARLQDGLFRASAFDWYPLSAIQSATPLRDRLINHVVAFENLPGAGQPQALDAAGALRLGETRVHQAAKFAFQVVVYPGEDMRVHFVHDAARHAPEAMAMLARSLLHLLHQVAETPELPVGRLSVCAPEEAARILGSFNDTARPYPSEATIAQLFRETAAADPDAVALRHGERSLDYRALDLAARRQAAALRRLGVQPGDAVGLLAPRGAELAIGQLAILYCGAVVLPMEPGAGGERIGFMLADSGATVLCTVDAYRALLPADLAGRLRIHALDAAPSGATAADDAAGLPPAERRATDAAYIMYTSGSTGQPKGCLISHRNIVRLVRNTGFVRFGPSQRILQTGSPAFDACFFETWGALLNGGRLCMADEAAILDAGLLGAALRREGITLLWLTSALFNQLCDADPSIFAPLDTLLVGGDVLSPRHVERARAANPGLSIVNGYGPTENTTFSATHAIDRFHPEGVPVGRPIANSTAYILDAAGNLLPPGAWGEVCVGGDGVSSGYLNRPELTAAKFADDPFRPGGRLYRTGDIGRWLPDGSIDLRGRNDFQVKIRGFRVELGEIERALCALDGVTEAAVVAREEGAGGKQLHAFYVAHRPLPADGLRAALAARLPSYMVPAFWLQLPKMPLTVNGKLDRRALPLDKSAAGRVAAVAAPPRTATEKRVAEICREVLGIAEVGLHDNFFELGANSLNLIAIHNRLKAAWPRDIPLAALFEHTSVGRLATWLDDDGSAAEARLAAERAALDQSRHALLKTRHLLKTREET